HDHAEQIAHSITRPNLQAQALIDLAQAVAATGDHDRARALATHAEQIARSITDPDQQAWALTALIGFAEPTRARSLIANALAVGRWTIPLQVLAEVDAEVLCQAPGLVERLDGRAEDQCVPRRGRRATYSAGPERR
ncbi:hypothetical protein, partial [Micromonospora sp. S-DT3-3-22]|uniref:hypothetical protein n=1 Tax=Micromonospora sp. S-DT3-3-22 TaxID=2755359 RepID=UPI001E5C18C1